MRVHLGFHLPCLVAITGEEKDDWELASDQNKETIPIFEQKTPPGLFT